MWMHLFHLFHGLFQFKVGFTTFTGIELVDDLNPQKFHQSNPDAVKLIQRLVAPGILFPAWISFLSLVTGDVKNRKLNFLVFLYHVVVLYTCVIFPVMYQNVNMKKYDVFAPDATILSVYHVLVAFLMIYVVIFPGNQTKSKST